MSIAQKRYNKFRASLEGKLPRSMYGKHRAWANNPWTLPARKTGRRVGHGRHRADRPGAIPARHVGAARGDDDRQSSYFRFSLDRNIRSVRHPEHQPLTSI
jgi:hypothetical protein